MNHFFNLFVRLSGVMGVAILFFVAIHRLRKVTQNRNNHWDNFWMGEQEANTVTKKVFPDHLLLTIDWDQIPCVENEKCQKALNQLLRFKTTKMVYLKGLSNTEVKKQYGINYFNQLVEYEETFYQFMKSLKAYGLLLEEEGFKEQRDAVQTYCNQFDYYAYNKKN